MTRYAVELTEIALAAITAQAQYIALQAQAPGSHLLSFTVDEKRRKIWIIGLRHGHRLPRPGELPQDPAGSDSEREDDQLDR